MGSDSIYSKTVTHVFLSARERPVTQVAFRHSDGKAWHDISWPDYFKMSEQVAAGLSTMGVKRGDRVVILSNTRYQWAVCDMAILGMGGVTVPIYQNSTPEDVVFILNNSQAVAVFIEDAGQLNKIQSLSDQIEKMPQLISFTPVRDPEVVQWSDLLAKGKSHLSSQPEFYLNEIEKNRLSDMATIVYTSGTTGQPKGVVLLHSCIASEIEDLKALLELSDNDSTLTFLPFAHIFGRIELWANIYIGWKMAFAESIDRIGPNLTEIRPTFMVAVPRIFEKIYSRILSQIDEGGGLKKKLFYWAVKVGSEMSRAKREGTPIPLGLSAQYALAYKLVFSKINEKLGGRIRFLASGGAPLSKEIGEFFHAAGILILEGYGLTETTAAVTANTPYKYRFGTVGIAVGDAQVKIAGDGEILVKSKKVFKEYYKNPEATAESLNDGWFATGDIGEVDADGFLRITDRKKDLIKTAGGKMIAPQKIENILKTNKLISQVVVYGDKMKYLVALITLNPEELAKFAQTNGLSPSNLEGLIKEQKVFETVREIVREKNTKLASYETIKNFTILPIDFTVESGELTPSLKVKRKYLSQKFEREIKELYSGHG